VKSLSLKQIAEWSGGELLSGNSRMEATGVCTDTRSLNVGDVFVALKGDRFDGHDFLKGAVEAGAACCIVESSASLPEHRDDCPFIVVKDTLVALQSLAKNYRQSLDIRVVGITGSNGKTSTKEMVAAVLGAGRRVQKTQGNLNNHIGVPLTLLRLEEETDWAVVEMGMSHPGEIRPLAEVADPNIGVITGIGWAHIEFFDSREGIAEEKGQLFRVLGEGDTAVFNGDDPFLQEVSAWTTARQVTCGFAAQYDFQIDNITSEKDGIAFDFRSGDRELKRVQVPLFGKPMARNAGLALAVAVEAGIDLEAAIDALKNLDLPAGRLEVSVFREGWLIDDTYNASPDSVLAAMESLDLLPGGGSKVVLLGGMAELGGKSRELHEWVGRRAVKAGVDRLIAVGQDAEALVAAAVEAGAPPDTFHVAASHQEMLSLYGNRAEVDDRILVKGSRAMKMENIVTKLKDQI